MTLALPRDRSFLALRIVFHVVDYFTPLGDLVEFGASPRASIALLLVAKARAFLDGRGYVVPQDVNAAGVVGRIFHALEDEAEHAAGEMAVVRFLVDHQFDGGGDDEDTLNINLNGDEIDTRGYGRSIDHVEYIDIDAPDGDGEAGEHVEVDWGDGNGR